MVWKKVLWLTEAVGEFKASEKPIEKAGRFGALGEDFSEDEEEDEEGAMVVVVVVVVVLMLVILLELLGRIW